MTTTVTLEVLRQAKRDAFSRLRAHQRHLIKVNGIEDIYGRGYHRYNVVKSADPRHGQLVAEFNAARDEYERAVAEARS